MDKISLIPTMLVYPSINIEANPKHIPEHPTIDFECEIGSACKLDDDQKTIHLNIKYTSAEPEENNLAYKIELNLYASFSMDCKFSDISKKYQEEIFEDIASLALGGIRETIASVTSRGPWGTYLVPFLSHQELGRNLLASLKIEKTKKPKANSRNP